MHLHCKMRFFMKLTQNVFKLVFPFLKGFDINTRKLEYRTTKSSNLSHTMRTFLVFSVLVNLSYGSKVISLEQNRNLHRSRRFAVPASSGWTLATALTFTLTVPLEGLSSSFTATLPFSYTLSLDG